jgi:hypothetical protein
MVYASDGKLSLEFVGWDEDKQQLYEKEKFIVDDVLSYGEKEIGFPMKGLNVIDFEFFTHWNSKTIERFGIGYRIGNI